MEPTLHPADARIARQARGEGKPAARPGLEALAAPGAAVERPLRRKGNRPMDTINRKLRALRGIPQLARGLGVAMLVLAAPVAAQWSTQSPVPTFLDVGVSVRRPRGGSSSPPTTTRSTTAARCSSRPTAARPGSSATCPSSLGSGLNGLFFLDDQLGWAWGNVNYRTTDGGTTWTELPFLGSAYSMEFYTASFGLATGNFGASVSRDGGLTWEPSPGRDVRLRLRGRPDRARRVGHRHLPDHRRRRHVRPGARRATRCAVAFLSATVAVGIVDGAFVRSTDGGSTWTAGASAAGRSRLAAVSADVVLAWGRSGTFPGLRRPRPPFRRRRPDLDRPRRGDAPGRAGLHRRLRRATVVAADLARATSTAPPTPARPGPRCSRPPAPLPVSWEARGPTFADAQTGYFGYGAGFVIRTTDGGATWAQISSGTGTSLNDLDRFARTAT